MTETKTKIKTRTRAKAGTKALSKTKLRAIIIGGSAALVLLVGILVFALMQQKPEQQLIMTPVDIELSIPAIALPPAEPTYPLTGLPAPSEEAGLVRPVSVKIENTPEARPQTGTRSADVVYETATEGGITRFNCIFQSTIPDEVGPVRSARNSDVTIVPQYDALFLYAGGNGTVHKEIAAAKLSNMPYTTAGAIYYRVNYREAPHNLYLSLSQAHNLAEDMGFSATLETAPRLEFYSKAPEATPDAFNITVPFSDYYIAQWTWDDSNKVYLRSMGGANTVDTADNQVVDATNVVVLWTPYVPLPNVLQGQTFAVNLNGSGKASLFVAGKRYDGTWETDGKSPPRFIDDNNDSIKLAPGKTWFQVLDPSQSITVS